jgi:uncharacterized Zn-finger protein
MDADCHVESDTQAQAGKKKRFQCEHCSRLFARLEHLQRHERIREYILSLSNQNADHLKIVVSSPSVVPSATTRLLAGKDPPLFM